MDDFVQCAEMWADPIVTRYIGGRPFSEEETWARFLRYVGHWQLLGFGYWAIEEKASRRFVGECGFADFKRDMEPSIKGLPEIGWVLIPAAHGKGYATEAVRAAIDWGESNLDAVRMVCLIDPGNAASMRVAQKCGFRECARTKYKEHSAILFDRLKPGFK
jgi:RimJ/RimL family protein N-acetyltransferase